MPYPPPYYLDDNPDYTNHIIDTHSFALLTSSNVDGPLATHIPMVRDGEFLYGHVSAGNPMTEFIGTSMIFLAAFHYFEMRMDSVRGIRKLSQNKDAATQARIIDNLRARGNDDLADEIAKIKKNL